jgi:7-carboxy-7-deazaguanine synthase
MPSVKSNARVAMKLSINEIFYSIQGESTYAGLPCIFVRLTACNLRCTYCDTTYAFYEGRDWTFPELMKELSKYDCRLVEITGGEPLIQKNVLLFMKELADSGYEVLLETGGQIDMRGVDARVVRIMDIKCPSSSESGKVCWENIALLTERDQVKFVIGDRADYEWAREVIAKYQLDKRCELLISPVFGKIRYDQLAGWILQDNLPVRFQLQLQKFIWEPDRRGV